MSTANETGAVEAIVEALSRTGAAGSARIMMFRGARDVSLSPESPGFKSAGPLFPLARLARWFVKNEAAARDAEGVIDFTRRRYRDTHVRRIRAWVQARPQTLELWDFGVSVDALDWTRLPVFRTDS